MLDLENKLSFPQNNTRFTRRNNGVYSELQYLSRLEKNHDLKKNQGNRIFLYLNRIF